ncbi:hypothetical protein [Desulfuromonas sp. TF]|uniref:hypothetical protein n=1 Tax=Desulfuromonas sp. TF TaxID=1232410 RepID=UPI00041D8B33|nr:hypothetical protein [Desulfuromonas sp. TF]
MERVAAFLFAVALLGGAASVSAADDTIRTCALTKAFECTSEGGCREWSIREMALPRFFRIDLKARTITSLDKNVPRAPTIITAIDHPEGMIVLHGAEKRGWSMTLGEDTGTLTLSATDPEAGFVVFGSCLNPPD